jgi:CYTH domain-containing protein
MTVIRRFAVASGLARLVEWQCGSEPVEGGHFGGQSGRGCYVHLAPEQCAIILTADHLNLSTEERAVVPRAHAEALLEVCAARTVYRRARVGLDDGRNAVIERFTHPGKLDLIAVEFDSREEADQFVVPSWFGPEISADPNFSRHSLATACPTPLDIDLSDSVLEGVLDLLDQGVRDRSRAVSEANEASWPSSVAAEAPEPLQIATPGAVIDDPPQAFEAQATAPSPASKASRPRQAGTARGHSAFDWQRITRDSHDARTDRHT